MSDGAENSWHDVAGTRRLIPHTIRGFPWIKLYGDVRVIRIALR